LERNPFPEPSISIVISGVRPLAAAKKKGNTGIPRNTKPFSFLLFPFYFCFLFLFFLKNYFLFIGLGGVICCGICELLG
jgi:hypothetical protein